MALVFFDGFEHSLNPNSWAAVNTSLTVSNNGRGFGSAYNGALNLDGTGQMHTPETQPRALAAITTQTTDTLYFGFAVNGAGNRTWRTNTSGFSWPRGRLPVVSLYAADNTEQISFGTEKNANSQILLSVFQAGSYVNHFEITGETGEIYNLADIWLPGWNYFEFEIGGIGAGGALGIAVRRNGQYLFPTTIALPNPVANIAKIGLHSAHYDGAIYDDFYVVNSSGAEANTWLGPETTVYSTSLQPSTPAEWAVVNSGNINTDDNDASYFKTNQFPKTSLFTLGTQYGDLSTFDGKVIGGISVAAKVRKTSLDAKYQIAFKQPSVSETIYPLGPDISVPNANYVYSSPAFVTENPATEAAWTPSDLFTNGRFGVRSVDPS